jgi:uncharacterized protein (TIGR00290 family)
MMELHHDKAPQTSPQLVDRKDSAWTLHQLRQTNDFEILGLVSAVTGDGDLERVCIHGVRMELLRAQAKAAGLPIHFIALPDPCSNEDYEQAMRLFVDEALELGVTHMAFGDLFLEDVRAYREERLAGTGMTPVFPIWGLETPALARDMIAAGVKARIVSVDLEQIGEEFLGREFDGALLDSLPEGCDPCGENGEFHSFAYDGPAFAQPIFITMGEVRRDPRFVHIEPRFVA